MKAHFRPQRQQPPRAGLRCCQRPAVTSRRTAVGLRPIAFRLGPALAPADEQEQEQQQGAPTVLLPLDLYACLKVTRTAGSRTVRDALDRALLNRPEAYYSSDTVALRDLLLCTAAGCLLNYDKRREYDAKALSGDGYVVSVSEDHLPGALVLLQDSGAHQLVLDLGAKWLAVNSHDIRCRDTAAAMALAHHALALRGLQQEGGSVLEACRHLEAAVRLSRESLRGTEQASAVADLQREALQLLKDYSPDYCLALLGLPLGDPQRPRGHALLRKLLHQLPDELSPLGPAGPDDFLAAARSLLTPQEHVELLTSLPSSSRTVVQQQLLAEAMVAVAFETKQPLLLMQAAAAYKQLERAAAQEGGGADACVERACIALLLGNADEAVQKLALGPGADSQQRPESSLAQQAAREYVLAHCSGNSDLLPGLYALAQCWVQQGILGSFRQGGSKAQAAPEEPLDLAPWFDSPMVRLAIMVLAVLARIKQLLQSVTQLPAAAMAGSVWLQQQPGTRLTQAAAPAAVSRSGSSNGVMAQPVLVRSQPSAGRASRRQASSSSSHSDSSSGSGSSGSVGASRGSRLGRMAVAGRPQQPTAVGQSAAVAGPNPLQEVEHQQRRRQQPQQLAGSAAGLHKGPRSTARDDTGAQVVAAASAGPSAGAGATPAPAAASRHAASPAAAATEEASVAEGSTLVARARAAAAAAAAAKQGGGTVRLDDAEDEDGPAPSAALRERLHAEMSALEAQMWDAAPEPRPWWPPYLRPLLLALLLGAVLVWAGGAPRSSKKQPGAGRQGPATLLIDARG